MLARIKLRYVLFITFTLISSVPVLLLSLWVQQSALDKEVAAVEEKHLLVAQNLTGDLTRYVIDVDSSFRLVAKNLVKNNSVVGFSEHIKSLYLRYISIINIDGKVGQTIADPQTKIAQIDAKILTILKPILEKSRIHIDKVFYSNLMRDENNDATFYLIKAVNNDQFVIGSLSTQHIIAAQQKVIFGKRGHAAIVDNTGRAIAHPIKNWVDTMKDMSFLAPVQSMMQGKTGVSKFYSPAMKADMVAGYTFVPNVGWGVMIPQPFQELEERAADVKLIALLITLFGIAVAGVIGWVFAGILARPIQSVVDSTNQKINNRTLTKVTTDHRFVPFEFRELLGSFNRMVEVIKSKTMIMEETSNRLTDAQRIAHVGNWEWNISHDTIWCSDEFYRICKISPESFKRNYQSFVDLFHPDDSERVVNILTDIQRTGGRFKVNHRIILGDKSERYIQHEGELHTDENGSNKRIIGIIHDISDRKRYETELLHRAHYDNLTDLPNRSLLLDRLKQETRTSTRNNLKIGLLSIDLDNFKIVNDTYGHIIGDKLLQQAAQRLKSCLRESDTLARFGGDEFCVILREIQSKEYCSIVANNIINSFTNVFTIDGYESFIGASIGITLYPDDSDDANTLIRNADIALYRVKESEKNNYCFFKKEMDTEISNRMQLSNDLRNAVKQNEFLLYYQPIINLQTGEISSAEALLRWIHPKRGFVAPDDFISLAEQTGLIGPLGEWVLKTACQQAAIWSQLVSKAPQVSVNLSVRQLKLGLTKEIVENIIKDSGIPAQQLILEITESLVINDTDEAIAWMESIKNIGVTFSVDDFGTGYSSLSYLKKLPVDVLKIDRAFINGVTSNSDDASLVKTIIAIGKSLNLKIVAEGVEAEQQLQYLSSLDCDYIQGYYYSKPLPADEFNDFLKNWDNDVNLLKSQHNK